MGVRDRHCPSCGAPAGAELEGDRAWPPPALEEPSYEDEEFEIHEAVDPGDDDYEEDGIEDADEVADDGEPQHVAVGPTNGASPPPYAGSAPQPEGREALVPRAQRTLRAGRRRARHWIDERRSGGR